MIVPKIGEICRANNKVGSATDLISLNFVIKPKLIIKSKNVIMTPPINPPQIEARWSCKRHPITLRKLKAAAICKLA